MKHDFSVCGSSTDLEKRSWPSPDRRFMKVVGSSVTRDQCSLFGHWTESAHKVPSDGALREPVACLLRACSALVVQSMRYYCFSSLILHRKPFFYLNKIFGFKINYTEQSLRAFRPNPTSTCVFSTREIISWNHMDSYVCLSIILVNNAFRDLRIYR